VGTAEPEDSFWQTFEYEVVTIAFEEDELEEEWESDVEVVEFEFEFATIAVKEKGRSKKGRSLEILRHAGRGWQFVEQLGDEVGLEMVAIQGGEFLMGSPADELDRYDFESPPRRLAVPDFYRGKYPVTQAQWRFVAGLPLINLELNSDPSRFKGNNCPVEQISWKEAVEFCDRLSQHTGRKYRLPSEAEWEYACRAGTTTPFHFGETIATDLANYRGTDWEYEKKVYPGFYGAGTRGEFREQTTDVGIFPANAFGLHDMHGNVWEWCLDHWHDSYVGAPIDGMAWIDQEQDSNRLLRGGSWLYNPANCRSAVRNLNAPDDHNIILGFRVVCSSARTL
jgi:formylglycine-generating enzyme required for sulfatase activity